MVEREIKENKDILDVVDEQDKIIGFLDREKIHKEGILHREVHVWIFDKNKNVYFQIRGKNKGHPGELDAPVGGHVDSGEDYTLAALREIKEEVKLSLSLENLVLLKKFRATSRNETKKTINNCYRSVFICKYPINEDISTEETEDIHGGFVKIPLDSLQDIKKQNENKFLQFILEEEIPEVIKYIESF